MEEELINNEKETTLEVLEKTMEKIAEAMEMTENKGKDIEEKEADLREEVRPVVVDEKKAEIEKLKENKQEFDEMTVNALVYMKKNILIERQEMEEKYEKGLLDFQAKKEELENKLAKMKERADTDEKLEMVEKSYNKALEQAVADMKELQDERNEKMAKLDTWESDITNYALRLNAEKELDAVTVDAVEEEKRRRKEIEEGEVAGKNSEPEKEEEKTEIEETKTSETSESKEGPEVEGKKPEEVKKTTKNTKSVGAVPTPISSKKDKKPEEVKKEEKKEPEVKIVIGNKGKIYFDGKEYDIDTETIRAGLEMREKNGKDFTTDGVLENMEFPKEIAEMAKDVEAETPIDFTVLLALKKADIPENQKQGLMKDYMTNVLKSQSQAKKAFGKELTEKDKEYEEGKWTKMDITYDMKDLSKVPFWKTLFARHPEKYNLTGEEKKELAELGNEATRYGLGETKGQYKETLRAKFLGLFTKNKNLLPAAKDMKTVDMTSKETIYETNGFGKEEISEAEKEFKESLKVSKEELESAIDKQLEEGHEETAKSMAEMMNEQQTQNNEDEGR